MRFSFRSMMPIALFSWSVTQAVLRVVRDGDVFRLEILRDGRARSEDSNRRIQRLRSLNAEAGRGTSSAVQLLDAAAQVDDADAAFGIDGVAWP